MAHFAHVVSGVIVNVIDAPDIDVANAVIIDGFCIESSESTPTPIGWFYNEHTKQLGNPTQVDKDTFLAPPEA